MLLDFTFIEKVRLLSPNLEHLTNWDGNQAKRMSNEQENLESLFHHDALCTPV